MSEILSAADVQARLEDLCDVDGLEKVKKAREVFAVMETIATANASLRAENERLRTATEIEREGQRSMARALSEINRLSRLDVAVHLVPSAENERLRAAATEALAVLTRLADSAAYWSEYDVPVGIVAEIDEAKARLAGVLS